MLFLFAPVIHFTGYHYYIQVYLNHNHYTHLHMCESNFEKVYSDLGLDGGFRRVLRFPPSLTTGSNCPLLVLTQRQYGRKSDDNRNSKILKCWRYL